jgi:hypothetical protein
VRTPDDHDDLLPPAASLNIAERSLISTLIAPWWRRATIRFSDSVSAFEGGDAAIAVAVGLGVHDAV